MELNLCHLLSCRVSIHISQFLSRLLLHSAVQCLICGVTWMSNTVQSVDRQIQMCQKSP
jgi:hypothetical protein